MPLYEHVVLARQDVSGQQVETLIQDLGKIIEAGGGTVGKTEYWGLKSISYRIRKNRKAHYTLMNLDASPDAVAELERQERLNSDILRVMTIRVDELEEGPSPMMRRSDRDDRDGRDGRDGRGPRGDRDRDRDRDRGERRGGRDRDEGEESARDERKDEEDAS